MKKQRGTRRRKTHGGNPLRQKLVNCIKEIVVELACSSNYNNVDNGIFQHPVSRLTQRVAQLHSVDRAIEQLTDEFLEVPLYQTILVQPAQLNAVYTIIEWYGLNSYFYLLDQNKLNIRQKIIRCITPSQFTVALAAASNNPLVNNALTADIVEDWSGYF